MPSMRVRFPGGRYHATPWGHHVNEGLIEWPPCPWRLLRALIATGYTKLGWGSDVPDVGRRLIETLAETLPKYQLPPASGAHSRHYMPVGKFKKPPAKDRTEFQFAATTAQRADLYNHFTEDTTLVFDTWVDVGDGEMVIHWDCELDDESHALFDQLVRNLGYLGRSESWVEAQTMDDTEAALLEFNAYPHVDGHRADRDSEQVALMATELPADYDHWRKSTVNRVQQQAESEVEATSANKNKKPTKSALKKARDKATAPYPQDLVECLQKDTAWWKGHRWSQPPGSRRVIYWRRTDALQISPPASAARQKAKPVTAMLLALTTPSGNHSALPHVSRTLPQAELLHDALVSRAGRGREVDCPEITGKDENGQPLRNGHRHAHILPLDLDGNQHLDHILVYAPMGMSGAAQHAVRGLKRTWTKGGVGDLQLALAGQGNLDDLRRLPAPLDRAIHKVLGTGPGATRWRSITPFVPPRFEKPNGKTNDLESQVKAELASRDLPSADVEVLPWDRNDIRPLRHYVRSRKRGVGPPCDVGYVLRLTFSKPVLGPISLGYGCHFGLGLFAQEPER